ncbi:hypothetical protein BRYFOR_08932 [Marvinbryantia formatexigens DSM 14469]|uniref:Uncharacterized protein n=1 Tax=Marvinbryantia formatexigens DSM 14469 TaxID=478749 RepID=C6LJU5_9FIRM|nr:hypothetical protein BRYFOR_08932 [Marvinbryantia formatexigens DSM 14469]
MPALRADYIGKPTTPTALLHGDWAFIVNDCILRKKGKLFVKILEKIRKKFPPAWIKKFWLFTMMLLSGDNIPAEQKKEVKDEQNYLYQQRIRQRRS